MTRWQTYWIQAIAIEKESQRLLDLAEKMQKGNEDF